MRTHEVLKNKNTRRAGVAAVIATLGLTGCSSPFSGGGKKEGIPNCPSGYVPTLEVNNQFQLIKAFEGAGQDLAYAYKSGEGRKDVRVRVAFQQLFNPNGKSGLFNLPTTTTTEQKVTADAYLADDPGELMCEAKDSKGDRVPVLSPNAAQAEVILEKSGFKVHIPKGTLAEFK